MPLHVFLNFGSMGCQISNRGIQNQISGTCSHVLYNFEKLISLGNISLQFLELAFMFSTILNCSPKSQRSRTVQIFAMKKSHKNSDGHRKLIVKVRFWHFLTAMFVYAQNADFSTKKNLSDFVFLPQKLDNLYYHTLKIEEFVKIFDYSFCQSQN